MNLATLIKASAAGVLLALAGGCAGIGGLAGTPESAVKARATQRWQMLIAGKFDDAYQLLAPGYRAVKSPNAYREDLSTAVRWISAEIVSVKCDDAEKCDAKVKLEARPVLIGGSSRANIVTHFDEKWIRVDGQWWHFPNR
jgi:hypothetical protein